MKKLMLFVIIFICVCAPFYGVHAQIISTIAGDGLNLYHNDNGPATLASLSFPCSVVIDDTGTIYIADEQNLRIRKVDTFGIITTIAGNGIIGYRGDDSLATGAEFCDMGFIKLGPDSNLYIPDFCNERIRKINFSTGIITTVAGNGAIGYMGEGGGATNAALYTPWGVNFDNSGNTYLTSGTIVCKINNIGILSRIAGIDSVAACGGDGGPATSARLSYPIDIALDLEGNLYISDAICATIRKIDASGTITTFAGIDSTTGYSGDGGPATLALLTLPEGIILDGAGNVYFVDEAYSVVRKIDHATNIITTVVGVGYFEDTCSSCVVFSGDGGSATAAKLNRPTGIAFDKHGNLYIADWANNRIRKVTNVGVPVGVRGNSAEKQEIKIYPNPAKDLITIEGSSAGLTMVRVLDLVGREELRVMNYELRASIDISGLSKGVYMIEITDRETGVKMTKRIVKM